MPEKKTASVKAKSAPVKKAAGRGAKGDTYGCEVCGLVVTVDEDCGCVDTCDIICCGEPMKVKKTPVSSKK